jgi:hypothetical protein
VRDELENSGGIIDLLNRRHDTGDESMATRC